MISKEKAIRISKLLSMALRHKPGELGIQLDANGWTDVPVLLERLKKCGKPVSFETLKHVVDTNEKKRFAFNENFSLIRASQGHSVAIELDYAPQEPPAALYHGTAVGFVTSILASGLEKRSRHHVHLSADMATAVTVGKRHGKPVVFAIPARAMHEAGFVFFMSANGVWLTDHVPAVYLKRLS